MGGPGQAALRQPVNTQRTQDIVEQQNWDYHYSAASSLPDFLSFSPKKKNNSAIRLCIQFGLKKGSLCPPGLTRAPELFCGSIAKRCPYANRSRLNDLPIPYRLRGNQICQRKSCLSRRSFCPQACRPPPGPFPELFKSGATGTIKFLVGWRLSRPICLPNVVAPAMGRRRW